MSESRMPYAPDGTAEFRRDGYTAFIAPGAEIFCQDSVLSGRPIPLKEVASAYSCP